MKTFSIKQSEQSINKATDKAKTSTLFAKPCDVLGQKPQPDGALYQIVQSNDSLDTFDLGLQLKMIRGKVLLLSVYLVQP